MPFVRTLGHPHPFTNSKVSSHNTLAVSSLVYLSIMLGATHSLFGSSSVLVSSSYKV